MPCEHVFVRWDNLRIESDQGRTLPGYSDPATVRTFDAPEALATRFYEVRAKSALNRVPKQSRMFFRWTINPYRGCSHACVTCFARPTHNFLDFNARGDFDREIVVKVNAPEVLRAELRKPSWKREHVALGTNTDPYQWVEGRYELMRGIWQALLDYGTPCSVLTKSPLVLRDLDLLIRLRDGPGVTASFSIPTLDEKAWRATEPRTPNPRARLEAMKALAEAGIPTSVLVAPLIPGINDSPEQVEEIVALCDEAGAQSIGGIALHLRGEVKEIWFDWLRSKRPDLLPLYERLYARGAYAPAAVRQEMADRMETARGKLDRKPPAFARRPDPAGPPHVEERAKPEPEVEQTALF
ncbi:MAG: radical SAM protein [Thermoleophilaceae bacterium]|nr:radical SAM protein [Thermoleophilaceae bacterium]